MTDSTPEQPASFQERYEIRETAWLDGLHGGLLAFDRVLRREVILDYSYRSDDNERFVKIAQLRARLRHANLVPIYDFSVMPDGKPFFTEPSEPHLQALELSEIDKRDCSLGKQVRFLLQVCEALDFIHANELLHLGLNPGNVLITQPFEEVFLVRGHPSLPAAQMAAEQGNLSDSIMGIPRYMAPEQVNIARPDPATPATDIYGLGGILYFILYGDSPNKVIGESLTRRRGPPSPGQLQFPDSSSQKLAKKLAPICLRALHSDRSRRQKNVKEFSKEIVCVLMR